MIKDRDIPHRETFEKEFSVAHVRFLAESRTDEVGPAARAWLSELRDNRAAESASKKLDYLGNLIEELIKKTQCQRTYYFFYKMFQ